MLEFYEEGGRIMFQVLLSPLEAVVEDLEILKSLKWEAIIVDEGQQSRVSTQFEQIKMLATDVKVLLFSGPIKESVTEYLLLLSLLNSHDDVANSDGSKTESSDNLSKLKERLSQYIACECKSGSSKFVEFWVPSQISNVQLEQYCATLLSNSISLCLCSKHDRVGALSNILTSTRKCCDHPYIVDPSLQECVPVVDILDVGIKASGKLQLLDVILSEIKKRELRVLILFQTIGGSGKALIGDILDDFLRQRFGPDSYERVDGGVLPSKKQAALNNFNKESGRFVFLLENRACLPSIRLSSVDTIVIFGSDWNPANDLKALQRISIHSRFEQIKIFRLYSSCTVEEKVLILTKQGLALENKLQNISRTTSDRLLMWGASYLFNRLDEFHSTSDANISSEQSLLNKVVEEFLALLSQNGESNDKSNSIILKIQQRGGLYSSNLKLLGELQVQLSAGEQPHGFWTNLLKGRNPHWKYPSGQTQRHRKRVQYFDESRKKPGAETVEVGKKRKKIVANCIYPATLKPGLEQSEVSGFEGGASGIPANDGSRCFPRSDACETDTLHTSHAPIVESEEGTLPDAQKSLHLLLKPDISRLCEILKLSEEVKLTVGRFLEYVIDNHHVSREPATILQAFLVSLCWSAVSLLKQKIDRKESLALAKHHLNFSCNEEEANYVYSKLRLLKKMFLSSKENIMESDFSKDSISGGGDIRKGPLEARVSQSVSCTLQNVKVENEEISRNQEYADERVHLMQAQAPSVFQPKQAHAPTDNLQPGQAPDDKTTKEDVVKSFKRVQRKCKKRMVKLLQKQQEETQEFHRDWEERRAALEKEHRLESAIIRSIHSHIPVRIDKLKVLDNKHAKKMEEHKRQKEICLQQLVATQLAAMNDERQKAARWLEAAKSSSIEDRVQDEMPVHGSEFENQVGYSQASESRSRSGSENDAPVSRPLIEQSSPDGIADNTDVSGIVAADTHETVPNGVLGCSSPIETVTVMVNPNSKNDEVENLASENVSVARIQLSNGVGSLVDVSENIVSTCQYYSDKQISDGILLSVPGEMTPPELPESVPNEVVPGADSVEMGAPAVESNVENDSRDGVCSGIPNAVENQTSGAKSSISGDSPSAELSLLKLPSTQPMVSLACDHSLSQNLVLQHECSQSFVSTDMQDEVPCLQPVDAEQIDRFNRESPLVEHLEQLQPSLSTNLSLGHDLPDQLPASGFAHEPLSDVYTPFQSAEVSPQLAEDPPAELSDKAVSQTGANVELHPPIDATEIPLAHNQPVLGSASRIDHQPRGDLNTSSQNVEAPPQVFEDMAELRNQAVPQTGANVELQPPIDATELPLAHNQPDLESASTIDHQPGGDLNTSSQNAEALAQVVQDTTELPNRAVFYPGANMSIIQGSNNLPLHAEHQVPSRIQSLPSFGDPLQNELERIRKETEQAIKVHEDTKLRLKSELEDIIVQIHRKYEAQLKDAEAAFLLKKNELDTNHSKVLMNKILADAFRSKCLDTGPSRPMGMQQVVPSGFAQQLCQLPLQPAHRPSPVTVSCPAGQPATSQQNTAPLLQPAPRIPPVTISSSAGQPATSQQNTAPRSQPALRVSPITVSSMAVQPAANQQSTAPPLQIVHQSAALFSSTPTRPPHINPITPSTGNLRVGGEIRAPAPHIQPFRPASMPAANFTSVARVMPSHPTPSSLPAISPSLPQSPPCSRAPSLLTNHSVPIYNRPPQSNTTGGLSPPLPTTINSSLSCLQLLTEIDNRLGPHMPNHLPPPPNLSLNLDALEMSEFGTGGSIRVGSSPAAVTTNVVCLSDDD